MPPDIIDKFKQSLYSKGYRITTARLGLFEVFYGAAPLSMHEILEKTYGKIDRVSVYRNVELFESLTIIRRINIGWKYKLELSDAFIAHHHHLNCITCGKIIDIVDEKDLMNIINETTQRYNFTPVHHQFDVNGYCANCTD